MADVSKMTDAELRKSIDDYHRKIAEGMFAAVEMRIRLHEAEHHGKGDARILRNIAAESAGNVIDALVLALRRSS
jgi:hypothetical protein